MGDGRECADFLSDRNRGDTDTVEYLVYENRIGFPIKLNAVIEFDDLRSAVLFARAKAMAYIEKGMSVENFNGHDWIWYAVDLTSGYDRGIMIQIFVRSQETNGEILIPPVDPTSHLGDDLAA